VKIALALLFSLTYLAWSQEFDVVAVKPHASGAACPESNTYPGGRLILNCFSLFELIREGLDLQPDELTGGPDWVKTEPWDITAKAEGVAGELKPSLYRPMLRKLAEQRFHLKLRQEKRLVKGFQLLPDKNPKGRRGLAPNTGAPYRFDLEPGLSLTVQRISMKEFAAWLKMPMGVGQHVDDKTGLRGEYDFVLHWSVSELQRKSDTPPQSDAPTIFTALREQLGLTLRPARVPGDVFIIEAAQRPEE
jgi:uncharacterized protein (TIGR03435 family)